jgi:multiple sugar transport system permease protein/sn-glycerol 3-phosphate transport system permease protein
MKNWNWFFNSSTGNDFVRDMGITLQYSFWSVAATLVLGLLLALLFNRLNKSFSTMRAIVFLPKYVGMSTAGILFLWILNKDYGIVNNVLVLFGIERIGWTLTEGWAMASVLMLTIWHSIGYAMMIYLSAMTGIPSQYKEAASLDGATKPQIFMNITLPLLTPTMMFLLVTQFISSMKVFNAVDIMTEGGPYGSTEVVVYLIYKLAFLDNRIDRSAVVALVFFAFLLVVTILTMRWSENKVNYDM